LKKRWLSELIETELKRKAPDLWSKKLFTKKETG